MTTEATPGDRFASLLRRVAALPVGPAEPVLIAGDRLGRFEIVREIGRGGFSVVYQARDTDLGRHVAIKVLPLAEADRARFADEATTAARLNHPNIVTLHDHGVHDGIPYLVLELLEGRTLRRRLDAGPLTVAEARDVGEQLARALIHAHGAGVVHRDVKPENAFLRDDGVVKLLDFGVSWVRPSSATGSSGTPAYMAPEQWRGEPHGAPSDVFALGMILHEALAGTRPFAVAPGGREDLAGAAPPALPGVPAALASLIARALSPAADARPTAQEVADGLAGDDGRADDDPARAYRYLEPFGEDDAGWFFGRARETARLRRLLDSQPVVTLAGPSGAGKSSLIRAGLVPRLRDERWRIVVLRPGDRPLAALADRCAELLGVAIGDDWHDRPGRLGDRLRRHLGGDRLLIFVDQAEQLSTCSVSDRDRFLGGLLAAADDPDGPVRLMLAIRDDFLAAVAQSEPLRGRLARGLVLLDAPDRHALADALVEPAQRLGFGFEAGLADHVVDALADEVAPLPLLQLAASRLWERRDAAGRTVTRAALDALGGVAGLLAHHADHVLRGLAPLDQEPARRILCALITPERTRRPMERDLLIATPAAERVLAHLIEGRLVTAARTADGEQIELAHESLITGWGQLRLWLDDAQARLRLRDRIAAAALHWTEGDRPRELLWRGGALIDAAALVGELSGRDRAFVVAALARVRRRRRIAAGFGVLAIAIAVAASFAAVIATRAARRAAVAARVQAILHRAETEQDPLVAALLIADLAGPEPPGGTAAALRVAASPVSSAVLIGHEAPVTAVAISHDGRSIATCANDGTCRIWSSDGRGRPRILVHGGTPPPVMFDQVGFTDDDRELVFAADRRLWRWPLDGRPPRVLALDSDVTAMMLAPGNRVVTGTQSGLVQIWDDDRPTVIARHGGAVVALDRTADGRILSGGHDRQAILAGGPAPPVVFAHDAAVDSARLLRDDRVVTIAGRVLRLWPADGGAPSVLADFAMGGNSDGSKGSPQVLPDGQIAYVGRGQRIMIQTLDDGSVRIPDRGHRGMVSELAVVGDGLLMSTGDDGQAVLMWQNRDRIVFRGHRAKVNRVAIAPGGAFAVTVSDDREARVWPLGGAPGFISLYSHAGPVVGLRFSPDGALLASVSRDDTARIWDVEHAHPIRVLPHGAEVFCAQWTAAGEALTAASDGLRLFAGDRLRTVLRQPGAQIACGAISPDGRLAVAASHRGAFLFDVATGRSRPTGAWEPGLGYEQVSFSPDGKMLLGVAFPPGDVYLWPVEGSGPPVVLGPDPPGGVRAHFTPDGARVVTTGFAGEVRVWSLDGREQIALRRWVHGTEAYPTRDGKRLVVPTVDRVEIQNVDPAGPRLVLAGHSMRAITADVSPDGRRAASGSLDGTARLWWITWADLSARLRDSTTACLTAAQRVRLLDESPKRARDRFERCERANGRID